MLNHFLADFVDVASEKLKEFTFIDLDVNLI
jgi:hypothetical protein